MNIAMASLSLSLFVTTFAERQRFAKPTRNEAQRVTVSRVAVTTVVPYERMRFAVRAALTLYNIIPLKRAAQPGGFACN